MTEQSFENSVDEVLLSMSESIPSNLTSNTTFVGIDNIINFLQITFYDPKENLQNYLSRDFEALIILSSFANSPKKILFDDMRSLLVKKIIEREVNIALRDANFEVGEKPLEKFVIDKDRFISLANEIEAQFNEDSGLYYTPYCQVDGVRVNPSGKLWERYNLVKKILRDAGILKSKSKPLENNIPTASTDDKGIEKIQWLQENVEPWDKVLQYWDETFDERWSSLKEGKHPDTSLHSLYECLKQENGIALIHLDFQKIQPNVSDDRVKRNWPLLCKFIGEYCKIDPQLKSNPTAQQLLLMIPNLSDDNEKIILLLLLAHMLKNTNLKPPALKKSGKKRKNPSGESPKQTLEKSEQLAVSDAVSDFIANVKIETQINEYIEKKKSVAFNEDKTVQPYMLFVGGPEKFTSFYVVVDSCKYKVDDSLKALIVNLEIFYSCNFEFPTSGYNVRVFIQKFLFGISIVGNKYPAKMKKMMGYINHHMNIEI